MTEKNKEVNPFAQAIILHKEQMINAAFAKKVVKLATVLAIALLISLILNVTLCFKAFNTKTLYFATNNGQIVPLYPTNQPAYSSAEVTNFGSTVIQQAFTLDFVNYRQEIEALTNNFTTEGFKNYNSALESSGILSVITDKRMNLSVMVSNGTLVNEGLINGVFSWKLQYPISIQLEGQNSTLQPQKFIVTMLVQRVDTRINPKGLVVSQIITNSSQ